MPDPPPRRPGDPPASHTSGADSTPYADAPLELSEEWERPDDTVTSLGDVHAEALRNLERADRARNRGGADRRDFAAARALSLFLVPLALAAAAVHFLHEHLTDQFPDLLRTLSGRPFGVDPQYIESTLGYDLRILALWAALLAVPIALATIADTITRRPWPGAMVALLAGLAGAGALWATGADVALETTLSALPGQTLHYPALMAANIPMDISLAAAAFAVALGWLAGREREVVWWLLALTMAIGTAWLLHEAREAAFMETLASLAELLNRGEAPSVRQWNLLDDAWAQMHHWLLGRAALDAVLLMTPWWVARMATPPEDD